MTEKLKNLLDEVTAMQDFASPDLDAIVRDGDRTVRRRQAAAGLAALVAAAVTVGGVVLITEGTGVDDTKVADVVVDSGGMSWATGAIINTPSAKLDVGQPVRAYVRTTVGFVTVDDRGRVWSVVDDEATEVGAMAPSSLYLTSDTEDSLAAWLEHDPDHGWSWVVFDQSLGRRLVTFEEGRSPDIAGVVVALDERKLYVSEDGDEVSMDVDDGTENVVEPPVRAAQLLAVEDGVFAWADPGVDDGASEYILGSEAGEVRIASVRGYEASFSPDGRWITFEADEPRVFDAGTGEQVEIDIDGRIFGVGYEWLDESSLAVMASRGETGPIELLVCEVPEGTCDVVAPDLGGIDALGAGFALPTGIAISG